MADHFDFGSFMDLDNQAGLRKNCISLFSALAQCPQDVSHVDIYKSALIKDPLVDSLEGLHSTVKLIDLNDETSIIKSMSLLNLVVPSLNDAEDDRLVQSQRIVAPALDERVRLAKTKNDLLTIAQLLQWIDQSAEASQRLHQLTDLLDQDAAIFEKVLSALTSADRAAAMGSLLATLLENHHVGFIAGDRRELLLGRGVEEWLANLVTNDALSDISDQDLLSKTLCTMQFDEEILDEHPDFMDHLMASCIILTSTGKTDNSSFLFLLLVLDEALFDTLRKINDTVQEVRN
jgi:hypothetical protein